MENDLEQRKTRNKGTFDLTAIVLNICRSHERFWNEAIAVGKRKKRKIHITKPLWR